MFLSDTFLFKMRNSKIKNLSGGELRYLEIKLILYSSAPYILLDEPFNGLYPLAAAAIREHIIAVSQAKGIILSDYY
jgi:ABC-type lipopolysaccharide export system ATPase subunit